MSRRDLYPDRYSARVAPYFAARWCLQVSRELHTIPAERNVFLDVYDRFAVLSPNFPENCDDLPKHSKLSGITYNFAEFATRFTEILPEIKAKSSEIFRYTENIEPS